MHKSIETHGAWDSLDITGLNFGLLTRTVSSTAQWKIRGFNFMPGLVVVVLHLVVGI